MSKPVNPPPVTSPGSGRQLEAPAGLDDVITIIGNARRASNFLKAVANENRLTLLCILARGEYSVTELETMLGERQTTVSQQLARLRLDDLVATRRRGKAVYYRLADEKLVKFITLMHELFGSKLQT